MNKEVEEKNIKLIEDYIVSKATENTALNYKSDLKGFMSFVNKDLMEVEVADVSRFFKSIEDLSYSSLNRKLSCIRDFYDYYTYTDDYNKKNPTGRMKRFPTENVSKTEPLSFQESKDLIKLIKNKIRKEKSEFQRNLHIRNLALIHLLLNTGLRISEALLLTFDELQLENKIIQLVAKKTKGKKSRTVELPENTIEYIENYLKIRDSFAKDKECKYVFISFRGNKLTSNSTNEMLKEYANEIGIEINVHNHSLRHSFGTNVYENTHDIKLVQELLDHEDISTSMLYIKNINKDYSTSKLKTANL